MKGKKKILKNQNYDENNSAPLEFQQIHSWLHLSYEHWEGAGQTPHGKPRERRLPSYAKGAPTGQVEIMLCCRHSLLRMLLLLILLWVLPRNWVYTCHLIHLISVLGCAGSLCISQRGCHTCGHFWLSQAALWQFTCHLVYKSKILGLIESLLALMGVSPLWWGRFLYADKGLEKWPRKQSNSSGECFCLYKKVT